MKEVRWELVAWAGIPTYVGIVDPLLVKKGFPAMSTIFRDTAKHPIKRWPLTVTWAYLTAHLFFNLPYDPLRALGRWLGEKDHS